MTKEIKDALKDCFMAIIDNRNNGMLAKHRMSPKSARILYENHISVEDDTVNINGIPMYLIETNYSYRFNKELMPTLVAIEDDYPNISFSSGRDR